MSILFYLKNTTYRILILIKLIFVINILIIHKKCFNSLPNHSFEYVYSLINENGCLIIKLVQWITSRLNVYHEISKPEWLEKLNTFFENCPVHNLTYSKQIYQNLTGTNLDDDYIIKDNISSGSIGQVYHCISKKNNKEYAIKIKHPDIDSQINVPKFFIIILNNIFKYIPYINKYVIPFDLDSFFINLEKQTFFCNEAQNIKKMEAIFKNEEYIIIPSVVKYNNDIIIMTYESGITYDQFSLTESDFQKYKICLLYFFYIQKCMFIENFNHGDLHCSNWKIRRHQNKKDYCLIIYDFGVCYTLSDIHTIQDIVRAWETNNIESICNIIDIFLCNTPNHIVKKIKNQLNYHLTVNQLKPFSMSKYFSLIYKIITDYNIKLEYSFFNLIISFGLCENILKKNGMLNAGIEINDTTNSALYQDLYLEYINFCKTKKCFLDLAEYYETVISKSNTNYYKLFSTAHDTLNLLDSNNTTSLEI